jgi:glutathione S-transferase
VEGLEPTALKEFEVAARVLEKGLAGRDFVLGAAFSAADILLAHTLLWARNAGALPASDVLEPYLERAVNRPALTRARQREATAMAP